MKILIAKYGGKFAALALLVGNISTLAACRYCYHQPEVPEKMKRLSEEKAKNQIYMNKD